MANPANTGQDWSIDSPKLLLVEGVDEVRVFGALAKTLGIEDIQIESYNGRDNLRGALKALPQIAGYRTLKSVGIVTDADQSASDAARRVRGALAAASLPVPDAPLDRACDGNMLVCYLILPHDSDSGALEDVCLKSVATDPVMSCVDDFFDCIARAPSGGPNPVWMSKARVHAYLASRKRPDRRLGEAADRGVWQFDAPAFAPLKSLLRMM